VGLVAAIVCATAMLVPLYTVLVEKRAMAGAADAAALAAADARSGLVGGDPCALAASVARANGAELTACDLDGLVVTVAVSTSVAGFAVPGIATAGPPDADDNSGLE
jgi:secretion/DNA translocation related TadE-like protein